MAAEFAAAGGFEIFSTQHSAPSTPLYVDAATTTPEAIGSLLSSIAPDYAINCAGILNSRIGQGDCTSLITAVEVNSRFPHYLASASGGFGTRVIHISTDGVFSGLKEGPYVESDPADAIDDYGRTKALGECRSSHVLNVRCSIVGRNPESGRGLLEWFLRVPDGGQIDGYSDQMWNGVTNKQLAYLCLRLIQKDLFEEARSEGHVLHFCPNPAISKYELLRLWRDATEKNIVIREKEKPLSMTGRVLASEYKAWRKAVDSVPLWPQLLQECVK